jgi:hypothetical protein
MKKAILALAVAALPIVAFGSQFIPVSQVPVEPAGTSLMVDQPPAQGCCIIYFMGRYYCVPCT